MAKAFAQCVPALLPGTLEVVKAHGFNAMTPVQGAAIPLFLSHKDVCAEVRSCGNWRPAQRRTPRPPPCSGLHGEWKDAGIYDPPD